MEEEMKLVNETGVVKEVKDGFSWTTLFFGMFVPLVRGDLKWAIIIFLIHALLAPFTFGIGNLIANIIFAVKYNKIYIRELREKGYRIADDTGFAKAKIENNTK
jgi:hypothetical protein